MIIGLSLDQEVGNRFDKNGYACKHEGFDRIKMLIFWTTLSSAFCLRFYDKIAQLAISLSKVNK